jgi:complex iron-sulfur molybdoenzyme family reductase subunit gamma
MKKITKILAITGLISSVATANAIDAQIVHGDMSFLTPSSKSWKYAKFSDVTLYPQTTMKMNDKKANQLNENRHAINAKVGVLYNGTQIAIKVVWPDSTKNVQDTKSNDSFADGMAIEIPVDVTSTNLPYIGMGNEGREVKVFLQKAVEKFYEPNGNGDVFHQISRNNTILFNEDLKKFDKKVASLGNDDYQKGFISAGVRSMTEIKDGSAPFNMTMKYVNGNWEATFTKSAKDEYSDMATNSFPISIAVWDGEKRNRDGLKMISAWTPVKVTHSKNLMTAFTSAKGDATKGQEAFMNNGCIGCHSVDTTPNNMGPNLANIGGYNTASYLEESIKNPNAVIVPGYNRNTHPNTPWYNVENGKRVSTMPDHSWMPQTDIDNIVAYLKTLKAEVK